MTLRNCDRHCTHADEVHRDRWGRPLIEGLPMTRVSTAAKALDDQSNLIAWSGGQVAVGMALPHSEDLREAAILARGDNQRLRRVQQDAKDRAGASSAATRGTSLHEVVALSVTGSPLPDDLSDSTRRSLDAFHAALDRDGLTAVLSEQFVVDTDRGLAGTFDLLLEDRQGRRYISDVKTGAKSWERQYPGSVACQLAAYQAGTRWCPVVGELAPHLAEADVGLLVSLPIDKGECHVDVIDIDAGRRGLDMALDVRRWRSSQRDLVSVYRG